MAEWQPFADGTTIGGLGSEDGTILRGEEHTDGSRITLERTERFLPSAPVAYAITCGIYGWMLHTRFLSDEAEALEEYEAMKAALAAILAIIPRVDDPAGDETMAEVTRQIGLFVERFP